jgi:outer membrane protein TolC
MKKYRESLEYSPLPVPPNGGKPEALLCQGDLHFQQSDNADFQPCKGKIFVAWGKATKECRPGLEQRQYSRPRNQVEKGTNLISDEKELASKRSLQKLILTFLLIGICAIANSQQTDSLMIYLELAAKNNPMVLQKLAEYEASLQKVPQVGSLPDPELNVGVFLSPMELVGGKQVADIRLMQMFPWFGQLKNAKDEMSLMAKAKFESFREAKLQVYFDVQQSWNELQKVQQSVRISEKNLEILRTLERLSLVKFKAASIGGSASSGPSTSGGNQQSTTSGSSGMNAMGGGNAGNSPTSTPAAMPSSPMGSTGGSGLADLYRIQMEIAELENSISLQKDQLQTISARFNSYLNRKPQTPVQLTEKLITDSLNFSKETISDSMLLHSPMLGMLEYEQQSLDARQQMVTKMGYPMVGLGLNYSLIKKNPEAMAPDMNGIDMIMPMVTLTLPIYRKKYKAMQEEVRLQKVATQQGYQAAANALQTEYYEANQLYQDARRRMKLYQNQVDLANKSLNILMKSFSSSGSGLTDLLRIRQQTLDYETKQIEAISENNTAIAWIKRLMACSQPQ